MRRKREIYQKGYLHCGLVGAWTYQWKNRYASRNTRHFFLKQKSCIARTSLENWDAKESLGNKGALLYRGKPCMCALLGEQPGHLNVRAVLRHFVPYKELRTLRRLRVYPCPLCSGNNLLTQTISAAKSENSISLSRPSTENVGGLFASIHPFIVKADLI